MQIRTSRAAPRAGLLVAATAALLPSPQSAHAAGVAVGASALIKQYDYSDTFTAFFDGGSNPARIYEAAVQPVAAYAVENTYGKASVNFGSPGMPAGVAEFSFASDGEGRVGGENPAYPGSSGAGSATGFTQTGGSVDYGVPYGLRSRYVVQVDAVTPGDRIDITSSPNPAGGLFQGNSLSVFFRATGGASLFAFDPAEPNPALRNKDTPIPGFNSGLTGGGQWHNYAVLFDQDNKTVELFVDEQSMGVIDLTTFAGGIYQNFSNAAVGVGAGLGGGENRTWTDNFQVGGVPEPTALATLGLPALAALARRHRHRAPATPA